MNNKKCHKRPLTNWITTCLRLALAGLFAAISACSLAPIAGSGTEEGNPGKVIGFVSDSLNRPVAGVTVRMLPHDYNPIHDDPLPDSLSTVTDGNGMYRFSLSDTGHFTIYCIDRANGTKALHGNVFIAAGDTSVVHDTLLLPGRIKVVLSDSLDPTNGYLYFPGTTIYSWLSDNSGYVMLDSVPGKVYLPLYYAARNSAAAPRLIKDSVIAIPGNTTTVAYAEWKYSKKLVLNTTPSGADVANAVLNFPVLVRLTASNFDFSRAKSDCGDIRFAKSNGNPLSYEIERWDPVAGLAEAWVKVDTVRGNDSTQSITMYWGNPNAADESNGAAVCDTTSGFTAVWHLNTDCSDITTGKHDGTNFGATDTVGIIGGAKKFNGSSYIQVPGLLGTPQSITLSAWVHLDSTISFSQDIVSLGDAVALRADRVAAPYYGTEGFFCSNVSASDTVFVFTNTGVFISKTGWRYLTYTVDGARHVQSMYIDGIFQCSTNDINPINYSGLGTNTFLGTHGNKKTASYAFGCIDEARVCRVARSADWIKLCYMNQKQQDALVRW